MNKILFFLFILSFNLSNSQYREATIIFNDTTSIDGFGEIKNDKILFKIELKDEPSEWDYEMAKGIIFSSYGYSEKYEYVKWYGRTKPKLLEVIDEGNVNLYKDVKIVNVMYGNIQNLGGFGSHYNYGQQVKNEYYIKKENEEYPTDINSNFKSKSIKYFSDCKILCEKINKGIFNKNTIEEMVNYYNNYCYDEASDEDASH